ncbi:hypothetical protein pb186bvf_008024 [Paramecium bursaria]
MLQQIRSRRNSILAKSWVQNIYASLFIIKYQNCHYFNLNYHFEFYEFISQLEKNLLIL